MTTHPTGWSGGGRGARHSPEQINLTGSCQGMRASIVSRAAAARISRGQHSLGLGRRGPGYSCLSGCFAVAMTLAGANYRPTRLCT